MNIDRVESLTEVQGFILNMRYAIKTNAKIIFQVKRIIDEKREVKYTNQFTINDLFPDEDPVEALKGELIKLSEKNYIKTVRDIKFPKRSEMRVFGKIISEDKHVYMKVRVELISDFGSGLIYIISFHYAETLFTVNTFPYQ